MPPLSFAIKCPIKNIEGLEWPNLEEIASKILSQSEQNGDLEHTGYENSKNKSKIVGPMYISKSLINNEEIEVCHSESTVLEDDQFSLNPMIFIRVAKQLLPEVKLPLLNLEKYYSMNEQHGISLEIVPNLTIQKNTQLIKLTQATWDEINENDLKFDPKFNDELL